MNFFKISFKFFLNNLVILCLAGINHYAFAQIQASPDDVMLRNSGVGGLTPGRSLDIGGGRGLDIGNIGGLSGLGIGNLNTTPGLRTVDNALSTNQQQTQQQIIEPLKPNDFQRFVLETTGYKLPLYGTDFFENLSLNPINNAPVSGDYLLGPGDQVLVRGWGSLDIDARMVIDRNGMVVIPRVGSITLAGVKANQAEGVIRKAVSKYYKGFEISVTLGQLRSITVYVVGQARRPGSYSISSVSTLASGLFATGGPNAIGSMRQVQLKRSGKLIAEFDLYKFLANGSDSAEIKLIDGDVIVIPAALGYVALIGKVNNPAVYEIKSASETLDNILQIAGGLPVVANARRVTLERIDTTLNQPRSVQSFALNVEGLKTPLRNGDLLTVASISPELNNAVTLRGNVTNPTREAWREGMRIRDLIPNKESLISRDSVRRQNEVLFDMNQRERTLRDRELKPDDLLSDSEYEHRSFTNKSRDGFDLKSANQQINTLSKKKINVEDDAPVFETMADSIGNLYDEINWEYALVERLNRNDLSVNLIPFNLAKALVDDKSPDNMLLQPGDIVTVFSVNDVRVPQAKRRLMVRVEGEVAQPGIYQMAHGETLQDLLKRAGGVTQDAYLFGSALYREEVKKIQSENLKKLIRRLENESSAEIAKIGAQGSAVGEALSLQTRLQAAQQAQKQAVQNLRQIKPDGRVALDLPPEILVRPDKLPLLRMQHGDRYVIPSRSDFVYVYGAVNTESAILFMPDKTVNYYLKQAGITESGDRDAAVLLRANGFAINSSSGSWLNNVLNTKVMPGDAILIPQKTDLEPMWSAFTRNAKDITQIFYQLGLGAAAIKTLRN